MGTSTRCRYQYCYDLLLKNLAKKEELTGATLGSADGASPHLYAMRLAFLLLCARHAAAAPPHIVFVLADDLGWNDVSFHGSPQIPTPTIDSLASAGVRLENYYVNPVCSPTRASLMSGRSQIHHGVYLPYGSGEDAMGLNLTYPLLPALLSRHHGYKTAMVGKWHLGFKTVDYLPSFRGFDKFFGYYNGILDYWKHYEDETWDSEHGPTGLDLHEGGAGLGHAPGEDVGVYGSSGVYSTRLFAEKAAAFIADHAAEAPAAPLFLYLAFQGVHSANNKYVQAPSDTIDRFASISPSSCGQWEEPLSGNCSKPAMRKTVAAAVSELDSGVETVTLALRAASMWETTLLVLSADNGAPVDGADANMGCNAPLRGCKGGFFEGGVRAIGLVHGAGLQKSGYGNSRLFHVADWVPTLLAAAVAGAEAAARAEAAAVGGREEGDWAKGLGDLPWLPGDGVDSWAAISADGAAGRTELIHTTQARGSVLTSHAMRVGELKLLISPAGSDCSHDHAGWYLPPGLPWNFTRFSVDCGGPPPDTPQPQLLQQCSEAAPCLFNLTADPCEYRNLAPDRHDDVSRLKARLASYAAHTVLPWMNFRHVRRQPLVASAFGSAALFTFDSLGVGIPSHFLTGGGRFPAGGQPQRADAARADRTDRP